MAYTTIDDPSKHMQVFIYTGNSTSTTTADRTLTNDGNSDLQPDLVWLHNRDTAINSGQRLWDSTRGVGQNKGIQSSSTGAEGQGNDPEFGYVNTLHSDGFGVRAGANDANGRWTTDRGEGGGDKYVAFQWKANGGSTTAVSESGSGDGAINACAHQANTTAGFSIIKYTGLNDEISNGTHTKVTHGLSSAPTFVLIKNIQSGHTLDWQVMGNNLADASYGGFSNFHLHLNTTAAKSGATYVSSTSPDANYVYVGESDHVNDDGMEYIMYAFHDVQGYSKFGSYEGNGDANGAFSYTGFKPAFVMVKNTESLESWVIYNDKMPGYNQIGQKIAPNLQDDQIPAGIGGPGYNDIDIYSNGFKIRTNNAATNESGSMHMYAAFAKEPLVTSGGIPATAR